MRAVSVKNPLSDLIEERLGEKRPIDELLFVDQKEILDLIEKRSPGTKGFGKRGFDILRSQFFVNEVELNPSSILGVSEKRHFFDTFADYYDAVHGDVYSWACYFGYSFSKQELKEYRLDLGSLNFDSFITYDCDDTECPAAENLASDKKSEARLIELDKRRHHLRPIKSYEDFIDEYNLFTKPLKRSDDPFFQTVAQTLFFQFAKPLSGDQFRDYCVRFVCVKGVGEGFTFEDVLFGFGVDRARQVIDNFGKGLPATSRTRWINRFKETLKRFTQGDYRTEEKSRFDSLLGLYVVEKRYRPSHSFHIAKTRGYFLDFESFAEAIHHDFRGANLGSAPIDREMIVKGLHDEKTILPVGKNVVAHVLEKGFTEEEFYVRHKWLNEYNEPVFSKEVTFNFFCDFVHYLKKDLSFADLLMCDGLENLSNNSGIDFSHARIRSWVAKALGQDYSKTEYDVSRSPDYEVATIFEEETRDSLEAPHSFGEDYNYEISYISDIHLDNIFENTKCESEDDIEYILTRTVKEILEEASDILVICGDVSHDKRIFERFASLLGARKRPTQFIFFVLGNHEFWPYSEAHKTVCEISKDYRELLGKYGLFLLQNDLYFFSSGNKQLGRLREDEINTMPLDEIRNATRSACLILFGGIGFAGQNEEWNARVGLYRHALSRKEEVVQAEKFSLLHGRLSSALRGKNVVVVSHMPMKDWSRDEKRSEGFAYISGHTHRNYYFDDGITRVFSDNQVGYHGRHVRVKLLPVSYGYDWFADYPNGIFEISAEDYDRFYRGLSSLITFNRRFEKLYLAKRDSIYMFFLETEKGKPSILNGGSLRKTNGHEINYFYEHMPDYAASIKSFMDGYSQYQARIASEIEKIGGRGWIHGSIIDIDFYNHLYVNPFDGTVTPYFAESMQEKWVYKNLVSLLSNRLPHLYANYKKLLSKGTEGVQLPILGDKNALVTKDSIFVPDTTIYKVSRILRGLQYTTNHNVIRFWNDSFVGGPSSEIGKAILMGITNPDTPLIRGPEEIK